MLRFILERHEQDHNAGLDRRDYYTIDIDLPEIEAALQRGGRGEMGFELHRLVGVEVLPPNVAGNRLARQGQSELTGLLGPWLRSELTRKT